MQEHIIIYIFLMVLKNGSITPFEIIRIKFIKVRNII